MEGVVAGVPSISVSMGAFENLVYDSCARFVKGLAAIVGSGVLPKDILLNVNYPNIPEEEIQGIAITRLGRRWYDDVLHRRVDPRGREYFWVTGKRVLTCRKPGTDAFELEKGFISITPLTLDNTNTSVMGEVTRILSNSPPGSFSEDGFKYAVHGPAFDK
jgi:5'-nucleotidase